MTFQANPSPDYTTGSFLSVALSATLSDTVPLACTLLALDGTNTQRADHSSRIAVSSKTIAQYTTGGRAWPELTTNRVEGVVLTIAFTQDASFTDTPTSTPYSLSLTCSGLVAPYVANPLSSTSANMLQGVRHETATSVVTTLAPQVTSALAAQPIGTVAMTPVRVEEKFLAGNYTDALLIWTFPINFRVDDHIEVQVPDTWDVSRGVACRYIPPSGTILNELAKLGTSAVTGRKYFRFRLGTPTTPFNAAAQHSAICERVGLPVTAQAAGSSGTTVRLIRASDGATRATVNTFSFTESVAINDGVFGGIKRTVTIAAPYAGFNTSIVVTANPVPAVNAGYFFTLELPKAQYTVNSYTTCSVKSNGADVATSFTRTSTFYDDRYLLNLLLEQNIETAKNVIEFTCVNIVLDGVAQAARNDIAFQITRPQLNGPHVRLAIFAMDAVSVILGSKTTSASFSTTTAATATSATFTASPSPSYKAGETLSIAFGTTLSTTTTLSCAVTATDAVSGAQQVDYTSAVTVTSLTQSAYESGVRPWANLTTAGIEGVIVRITFNSDASFTSSAADIHTTYALNVVCTGLVAPYLTNPLSPGGASLQTAVRHENVAAVLSETAATVSSPLAHAVILQAELQSGTTGPLVANNFSDVNVVFRLPLNFRQDDFLELQLPSTWDVARDVICRFETPSQTVYELTTLGADSVTKNQYMRIRLGTPPPTFSSSQTMTAYCQRIGVPATALAAGATGTLARLGRGSDGSTRALIATIAHPAISALEATAMGGTTRTVHLSPRYTSAKATVKATIIPTPVVSQGHSLVLELSKSQFTVNMSTTSCTVDANGVPVTTDLSLGTTHLKDRTLVNLKLANELVASPKGITITCTGVVLSSTPTTLRRDIAFFISSPDIGPGAMSRIAALTVPAILAPVQMGSARSAVIFSATTGVAATSATFRALPAPDFLAGETVSIVTGASSAASGTAACTLQALDATTGDVVYDYTPSISHVTRTQEAFVKDVKPWAELETSSIEGNVITVTLANEAAFTSPDATSVYELSLTCSNLITPYLSNPLSNGNWLKGAARYDPVQGGDAHLLLPNVTSALTPAAITLVQVVSGAPTQLVAGNYSDVNINIRLPANFRQDDHVEIEFPNTWDVSADVACRYSNSLGSVHALATLGTDSVSKHRFVRFRLGTPPINFSPSQPITATCERVGTPVTATASQLSGAAVRLLRAGDFATRASVATYNLPAIASHSSTTIGGVTRTLVLTPPYMGYTTTAVATISPVPPISATYSLTLELPKSQFTATNETTCTANVNGVSVTGTFSLAETTLADRYALHFTMAQTVAQSTNMVIMTCQHVQLYEFAKPARRDIAFQVTRPLFDYPIARVASLTLPPVMPPIVGALKAYVTSEPHYVASASAIIVELFPITVNMKANDQIKFALTRFGGASVASSVVCSVKDVANNVDYPLLSANTYNNSASATVVDNWVRIVVNSDIPRTKNITIRCNNIMTGPVELAPVSSLDAGVIVQSGTDVVLGYNEHLGYGGLVAEYIPTGGNMSVSVPTVEGDVAAAAGETGNMLLYFPHSKLPLNKGDVIGFTIPQTFTHRVGQATNPTRCSFNDENVDLAKVTASIEANTSRPLISIAVPITTLVESNGFVKIACSQIRVTPYASAVVTDLSLRHQVASGAYRARGPTSLRTVSISPAVLGAKVAVVESTKSLAGEVGTVTVNFSPMINSLEPKDLILVDLATYAGFLYSQDGVTTCTAAREGVTVANTTSKINTTTNNVEVTFNEAVPSTTGNMSIICTYVRNPRYSHAGINGVSIVSLSPVRNNAVRERTALARALPVGANVIGGFLRTVTPSSSIALSPIGSIKIALLPLLNPLGVGSSLSTRLPEEWIVNANVSCHLLHGAGGTTRVNGTTVRVDSTSFTVTLTSGAVEASQSHTLFVVCDNIQVPPTAQASLATTQITTRLSTGIIVDRTTTARTPEIYEQGSQPSVRSVYKETTALRVQKRLSATQITALVNLYKARLGSKVSSVTFLRQRLVTPPITTTSTPASTFYGAAAQLRHASLAPRDFEYVEDGVVLTRDSEPTAYALPILYAQERRNRIAQAPRIFADIVGATGGVDVSDVDGMEIEEETSQTPYLEVDIEAVPSGQDAEFAEAIVATSANIQASLRDVLGMVVTSSSASWSTTWTSCSDATKNGAETDVDCGGNHCGACGDFKKCTLNSDCLSNVCVASLCDSLEERTPTTTTTSAAVGSASPSSYATHAAVAVALAAIALTQLPLGGSLAGEYGRKWLNDAP